MPIPPKMAWATMTFCDEVQSPAEVEAPLLVTALVGEAVGSMLVPAEKVQGAIQRVSAFVKT